MPVEGRLPAVEDTFTIAPPPAARKCGSAARDCAHVAHDVQLPVRVPLLVGHLLELGLARDADVVDENLQAPQAARRFRDGSLRLARLREIGRNVQHLADARARRPGRRSRPGAPSAASSRAVSRPIPLEEPVTRQRRSRRPRSMRALAYRP